MTPNFALGLTQDGITLWLRCADGWRRLGAVPLDAGDLDARMARLVAEAHRHAPDGLATKLVIPDDQVLYARLDAPAPTDDGIRAALAGRTPYPVEELAFDWAGTRAPLQAAVVAQETLAEAEAFAETHGLNPVCFVAAPPPDSFPHEPFFGPAARAGAHLDNPAALIGEGQCVVEVGPAPPPPDPVAAAPDPVTPAPEAAPAAAAPDAQPAAPAVPAAEPAIEAQAASAPDAREPDPAPATPPPPSKPAQPAKPAAPPKDARPRVPKTQAKPAADSTPGFRSRRGTAATASAPAPASATKTALDRARALSPGKMGARLRGSVAAPANRARATLRSRAGALGRRLRPGARAAATASTGAAPRVAGAAGPDDEAKRLTIFGARQNAAAEPALPQRALLVTGGALLLLLALGVWLFYFNAAGTTDMAQRDQSTAQGVPPNTQDAAAPQGAQGSTADAPAPSRADAAEEGPAPQSPDAPDEQVAAAPPAQEPATSDGSAVARPESAGGRIAGLRSVGLAAPEAAPNPPAAPPSPPAFEQARQGLGPGDPGARRLPPGEEALEIAVTQSAPAAVPPARPDGLAPVAPPPAVPPEALPDESTLDVDVTTGTPPETPPDRPADIAPSDDDQASLRPAIVPGGVALTALRPATRPAAVTEAVTDAAPDTAVRFAGATPQAVPASLRPGARPDRIVQAAARAAPAPAAAVVPDIPSTASVTRAATRDDTLDLRDVNLLGVMGTDSNRRALVRLANGRIVTVQVGARLDGGQVIAIGEDELRYSRRGRAVRLELAS